MLTLGQPWAAFAFSVNVSHGAQPLPAAAASLGFSLGLSTPARTSVPCLSGAGALVPVFVASGGPAFCKGDAFWTATLPACP